MRLKDAPGEAVPFSIEFVKVDVKKKKGGQLREYHGCVLLPKGASPVKNPDHDYHSTINLKLSNGQLRKVHARLITRLNGEEVLF